MAGEVAKEVAESVQEVAENEAEEVARNMKARAAGGHGTFSRRPVAVQVAAEVAEGVAAGVVAGVVERECGGSRKGESGTGGACAW